MSTALRVGCRFRFPEACFFTGSGTGAASEGGLGLTSGGGGAASAAGGFPSLLFLPLPAPCLLPRPLPLPLALLAAALPLPLLTGWAPAFKSDPRAEPSEALGCSGTDSWKAYGSAAAGAAAFRPPPLPRACWARPQPDVNTPTATSWGLSGGSDGGWMAAMPSNTPAASCTMRW